MKEFFGIEKEKYCFEFFDLTSMITILNVTLVLLGFAWAPWVGIVNCVLSLVYNGLHHIHINSYVTNFAIIVLNVYFLTL